MKSTLKGALLALMMAGASTAGATTAQAEAPFMQMLGATSAPIGYVELCQRSPEFCIQRTSSPTVVTLTQNSWHELLAVNHHVNQTVLPITDHDLYGQIEVWTMPNGLGDCEDYVLMKRDMLIARGWPASALLITVVRERSGQGHAVLTVRTDRGDFILDNQAANVLRWDQTPYTYIKRQSEFDETVWASIHDARV
ncbi:MAG: transglutaminase-like cysteine peptidase [Devosiaceae bacterium]|nr:transglutaminase-like cysteine peptidase [Devosiaceae bacterium MH13]